MTSHRILENQKFTRVPYDILNWTAFVYFFVNIRAALHMKKKSREELLSPLAMIFKQIKLISYKEVHLRRCHSLVLLLLLLLMRETKKMECVYKLLLLCSFPMGSQKRL